MCRFLLFLMFYVSFHFVYGIIFSTRSFNFCDIQFIRVLFYCFYFVVITKKSFPSTESQRISPAFSSEDFTISAL